MRTSRFLTALILVFTILVTHGQKSKTYQAWVTLANGQKLNGVLSDANEAGIVLLNWKDQDSATTIGGGEIKVLKFRRKGSTGRGAWIGAVSGAVAGLVIGFADGDDEAGWFAMTAEEKALSAGIGLAVPGTFIGMIIGSLPKRFAIKGNGDTYISMLPEIRAYITQPKTEKTEL